MIHYESETDSGYTVITLVADEGNEEAMMILIVISICNLFPSLIMNSLFLIFFSFLKSFPRCSCCPFIASLTVSLFEIAFWGFWYLDFLLFLISPFFSCLTSCCVKNHSWRPSYSSTCLVFFFGCLSWRAILFLSSYSCIISLWVLFPFVHKWISSWIIVMNVMLES